MHGFQGYSSSSSQLLLFHHPWTIHLMIISQCCMDMHTVNALLNISSYVCQWHEYILTSASYMATVTNCMIPLWKCEGMCACMQTIKKTHQAGLVKLIYAKLPRIQSITLYFCSYFLCVICFSCHQRTPLHTSVMAGDMDKVKSLVVNGADINARDEDEVSIL